MTITLILVLIGLVALLFLLRLAKGRSSAIGSVEDLSGRLRPVDVEAFRNLVDPAEEQFLRANLLPAEFRKIQRERLRAAIEYISCAARNAAVLIRMGEAARRSSDPSIAEAGERLVDSAIRLRLYAFQTVAKLYLGILLPGARLSPMGLAESYEQLTGLGRSLGRLEYQTRGASASL
jgi:hypothetical protein